MNRRQLLAAAAAGGLSAASAAAGPAAAKGRVKQSVVSWCFSGTPLAKWTLDQTCRHAADLGCKSVELVGPDAWPTLQKHGLTCAIAPNGMPGKAFMRGWNNPRFHDELAARTKQVIDAAAAAGVPSVIAFTGYKWVNPDDPKSGEIGRDEGAADCVKGLKALAGYAESKGVTVCLEHLNSRDDTHPMKGHPGYQGDDVDYCADILRRVGSPRVKLLFDVYHVQIMNGDLIRRVGQLRDVIGHVHTAGCPGRGELDDAQEVNYPAVVRKLVEVGYAGYVGQEFIPTRDPLAGLREAVAKCDV